jgi:hypothetical protein
VTAKRAVTCLAATAMLWAMGSFQPGASAGPPSRSACTLPATDLCRDYVTQGKTWSSLPISYAINLAGAPPGAEQDIHDAFQTWQDEVGSSAVESAYPGDASRVAFQFTGHTTARGGNDGVNVVYFDACSSCGASAETSYASGKRMTGFDIFVNATRAWETDLTCPTHACGSLDLQNALTHEIGHALDLYHPTSDAAAELTMYAGAVPDEIKKRDLGAGEVVALRTIYPG